jgi:hypothetical protein
MAAALISAVFFATHLLKARRQSAPEPAPRITRASEEIQNCGNVEILCLFSHGSIGAHLSGSCEWLRWSGQEDRFLPSGSSTDRPLDSCQQIFHHKDRKKNQTEIKISSAGDQMLSPKKGDALDYTQLFVWEQFAN